MKKVYNCPLTRLLRLQKERLRFPPFPHSHAPHQLHAAVRNSEKKELAPFVPAPYYAPPRNSTARVLPDKRFPRSTPVFAPFLPDSSRKSTLTHRLGPDDIKSKSSS